MSHRTRSGYGAAFATFTLSFLFLPHSAFGDGGFMPPYEKDIWEPAQKALILYDDETRTEDMILQVDFEGNTDDFAWIVPVPSLPNLGTADYGVFWDCALLTVPLTKRRDLSCSNDDEFVVAPQYGGRDVEIYSRETVGIYQTITLGADDSEVLADSLENWGYLHQGNRKDVLDILQFYIDKSWYFVTMQIDSSSVGTEHHGGYWNGPIDPIRLTFAADEIVYPMRVSAMSAADPSEVLLYICAPHRVSYDGAATEYANRLSASELSHIRELYPHLGRYLTRTCFITKLRRTFRTSEMDDDIVLERAANDAEYRDYASGAQIPFTEVFCAAVVAAVVVGSRRGRRSKSPAYRIRRG